MWEGGQAGDTLRLLSPVPTHQEPLATPIMAVGLPTWQSQPPRALVSAAGALRRAWPGRRQRAREGGPGKGWGPEGRRDCWVGPGPPPPALCPPLPPTRSSRRRGESPRCRLCSQPAGRAAPTCRVGERGAPPARTLVFPSPSETSCLATRVSDRRRCDARTGRQARSWCHVEGPRTPPPHLPVQPQNLGAHLPGKFGAGRHGQEQLPECPRGGGPGAARQGRVSTPGASPGRGTHGAWDGVGVAHSACQGGSVRWAGLLV